MRKLRGSAPSGVPVRCGGLSSLRRLRRSASAAYFIVLFIFRGTYIFCAGCGDPRPLALPDTATASLFCTGYADLRLVFISYNFYHLGGLKCFAPAAVIRALSWALLVSSRLVRALLASSGSSGRSWLLLCSSGLVWALLGSSWLLWALQGSPGLS